MSIRARVASFIASRLGKDVPLRLVFWDGHAVDLSNRPTVTLTLATPRCARLMLKGDLDKLCAAYVSGEILVDGAIPDILNVGLELAQQIGRLPLVSKIARTAARIPRPRSRKRDAENVRFHYDVSNDFYRLWLDELMIYSCAYFRLGNEDIHQAQRQKLDHICRKLRLEAKDRFLDIGCGWGGLLRWAAVNYGVTGVGATISTAQLQYVRAAVTKEGLAGRVEIRMQDYRDIPEAGSFDKIASVGMYEHVGLANLQSYFDKAARLLRPGGVFLNHGIYLPNADGRAPGPSVNFLDRYVFPGGALPTLSAAVKHLTVAGFEILDFEDLRPHYTRTLALWLAKLESSREAAIAFAGEERYRIWRMFLGAMAYAFDAGWLSVGQFVACKPAATNIGWRPWTREHQYTGASATIAPRLNWYCGGGDA
ncbi:MAG TPA: cyclopropane-fatty-acyl-phospholipid synthase family protein [Hyphomicrobiales bacterium]|nr:cyclopropane-fatty-acyl-phospholipid synthase family protein [Hyphomicrobiales bacterium]